MSEATPFIELPVSYRVMAVEEVRQRLRCLAEQAGHTLREDPPLSLRAEVWLKRLRAALSDPDVTSCSVAEMDAAMHQALPEAEDNEVHRRLIEFELLRDAIPHGATSTEGAMPAVLKVLARRAEA